MGAQDDGGGTPPVVVPGAADAFAEAYRLLAPQIRGYARRQVPDDVAEDVVSETFLVLWRRWPDAPHEPEHLRPWVFGVARNKIVRAREQQHRVLRSVASVAAVEPTRGHGADPAVEVAGADRARRLLDRLPPAEGEAMALTVWAGLTPGEAAEVLGCSVTALTSRLSRARARLAAVLAEGAGDRPPTPDGTAATTHDPDGRRWRDDRP